MKWVFTLLLAITSTIILWSQSELGQLSMEEKTFKSQSGKEFVGKVGTYTVLENRANPKSAVISVNFIRLKSPNPNPQAPLIYLEGGPGSACTWQASNPYYLDYWADFLELGDVILYDQRGTGKGGDRVTYIWQDAIPKDAMVSAQAAGDHAANIARKALPYFKEKGVDLTGYTTKANAEDIDDLRQALGIQKLNLFGFSYGTHLGQAYIRYFSDHVEKAILVGVEGPNHTYKLPMSMDVHFQKIAQLAKQDPAVNKEVPDLWTLYKTVIEKLKKEPVTVEVTSPLTRQKMSVKVGPFGFNLILRLDIGDASDLPVFPRLLYSIKQGDYSALEWFIQKRITMLYGTQGMAATMDMASGASKSRQLRIKEENGSSFFRNVVNPRLDAYDQMGSFWPDPDLGEDFRAPMISNVPTLFMSGTLDFNTPPYQAEEVRWGFSNSSHVVVKNAGHEQILTHPDAIPTVLKFLQGESVDEVALAYPSLKFIPVKGKKGDLWHPSLD